MAFYVAGPRPVWRLAGQLLALVGSLLVLETLASERVFAAVLGVGDEAPAFRLAGSKGTPFELAESLRRHPVLIAFVSVQCKPCEESIPALVKLRGLHDADDSVETVCVAESGAAALLNYQKGANGGETATWLLDNPAPDGTTVADRYGVLGTPAFFLIARDGKILWRHLGKLAWERVEREISKALRPTAAGAPHETRP